DLAGMLELCAPNYVSHGTGVVPDMDLAGWRQLTAAVWTAFPDLHATVEDVIAEGDKVVRRFTLRGTHQGEFMGIGLVGSARRPGAPGQGVLRPARLTA